MWRVSSVWGGDCARNIPARPGAFLAHLFMLPSFEWLIPDASLILSFWGIFGLAGRPNEPYRVREPYGSPNERAISETGIGFLFQARYGAFVFEFKRIFFQ